MAVWEVSSRVIVHPGGPATTRPVVTAFLADVLPGTTNIDEDYDIFRGVYEGTPDYRIIVRAMPSDETVGGVVLTGTSVSISINFDESIDDAEEAVAQARLDGIIDALAARLERDAPADHSYAMSDREDLIAPAVTLASIAADHFGDPAIFQSLVSSGRWTGTVVEAGVAVDVTLDFPKSYLYPDKHRLDVAAAVHAASFVAAGRENAQTAVAIVVEALNERIERQLEVSPPPVTTVELHAAAQTLPRLFFGADDTLNTFAGRFGELQWKEGTRTIVLAPEADLRAELSFTLAEDATGSATTDVTLALQSVGGGLDEQRVAPWREAIEGAAAALVKMAGQAGAAPSFGIRAAREVVLPALRTQLAQVFPSNEVEPTDTGFSVRSVELAENVWAWVDIAVTDVGDWDTQITFTGGVSQGYSEEAPQVNEAQARVKYRDAIARAAHEIREALDAVAIVPTTRPDMGMDL